MEPVIVIKNISKSYSKRTVLKDINLTIKESEIYGFIGPSGAGKTTLIKIIVGMERSDSGKVQMLNKTIPNLELLQDIGYMAQSDALYNELTAEENLKFFGKLFKLSKLELKNRIEYVANLVNLKDELNKKVCAYSGGMKRRLSLAIALIQNPSVLILDEPTVGIDPELRVSIWNELHNLRINQKKTIIVTTHVMDEASKCDVLAMVRDGNILANGTPESLIKSYNVSNLEEVFLKAGGENR